MPEIPAEPGNWGDLVLKICGLMIDPNKVDLGDKLDKAFDPQMRVIISEIDPDSLEPPTQEEFARAVKADPLGLRFDIKLNDFLASLLIAGRTLEHGLRLAEHAPRQFSLNRAIELVQRELAEAGLQHNDTFVRSAWRRLKPFSHFICALVHDKERVTGAYGLIGGLPSITQPNKKQTAFGMNPEAVKELMTKDEEQLRSFGSQLKATLVSIFADAEALRRLGERRYGRGQKVQGRPFLDPETSWSIPAAFELPDVELKFEPLTEDEIAILNGAK